MIRNTLFISTLALSGAAMASLAQAQAVAPPPRRSGLADGAGARDTQDVLRRLEVMRRVIVRSLNAAHADIAAVDGDGDGRDDHRALGTVGGFFGAAGAAGDYESRVDYLPGYGAIFTLSVPVRVRTVTRETGTAAKDHGDASDRLWEELEHDDGSGSNVYYEALTGKEPAQQRTTYEYDGKSLQALKETLAKPLAQFARRVALPGRDWVGVSVRLVPSFDGATHSGRNSLYGRSDANVIALLLSQKQATQNRGHRLVLQIASEELITLGQEASAQEVLQKAEVDVMSSAISITASPATDLLPDSTRQTGK